MAAHSKRELPQPLEDAMPVVEKQVVVVVGRNLKRLRLGRAMSRASLAKQVRGCEEKLASFEKGETMPDHTTLLRLADVLNVTLERIFDGLTLDVEKSPRAAGTSVPRAGGPSRAVAPDPVEEETTVS
ncbi:helix-turn-helix transcriptional regulator [Marivibrio halodurans]|uniref:Helix-turn-helix transcriptional regulator n=1 Tax=Marivibrio halodurans TaxID=2039722 RepID=A0A8J7SKE4_9PROT|nr:helix-turn-helix transcriptional regulator [Marivibrio halodurans]MBP5855441.1 helix-turn-helix transcriptional regulator [Marivibrio halodurans]